MAYPIEMQDSIRKVETSRGHRMERSFRRLNFAEKAKLLETYHPDFRLAEKREIPIGPNKEDMAPSEFVALLESPSRLNPEAVDLGKVNCNLKKA
jgi:succinate dehydrogenase / fumarate reductase flavoprotein subunit